MRHFGSIAGCLCALLMNTFFAPAALAQDYPSKPVRLVVTFPPGGANDIIARILGQALTERLGQAFVIDNRVGGGGNIGASEVVRAAPDGYTLLQASVANATNTSLYENLSFNFVRDIAPVAGVYQVPLVIVTSPTFPAKTFPDFVAFAKAHPGKINYGSGGVGTLAHIGGELLKMMTGTDMVHVPYRGSPAALVDLLNSRIDILFDPLPTSLEYVRSGKLTALAVTTAERSPSLSDTPTVGEFLPGYAAAAWVGITAPKATPGQLIDKLNTEINAVLSDAGFKSRLAAIGAATFPTTPGAFGRLIESDTQKWAKVITTLGIKAE
jgi:tripartite-type tricarboxylate transporter receptor subunit TctC